MQIVYLALWAFLEVKRILAAELMQITNFYLNKAKDPQILDRYLDISLTEKGLWVYLLQNNNIYFSFLWETKV